MSSAPSCPSASSSHAIPAERSHQEPIGSERMPELCASRLRIVRSAYATSPSHVAAGSSRASCPSRTSWSTSTAVRVLVIEPMRYCTSRGSWPGTASAP